MDKQQSDYLNSFREYLNKYIAQNFGSIGAFEKKYNLSAKSVRRFLNGQVNNPSIEMIKHFADAIDCSIDEMCGRTKYVDTSILDSKGVNKKLFIESSEFVSNYLRSKPFINIDVFKVSAIIKEICLYIRDKRKGIFDQEIAELLLEKTMLQKGE